VFSAAGSVIKLFSTAAILNAPKNCCGHNITYFCPRKKIKMKIDKSIAGSFVLLVLIASLYRILPGRPLGFAPQIAMALFSGSIIKNKQYAFLLPLMSMLVSDVVYEVLFTAGISPIQGFYDGQWINYLLFAALTVIGFAIKKEKWLHIAAGSFAGVIFYFLTSNFAVWIGGGLGINNLPYAKSFAGLSECYTAGLPFLKGSLAATLLFSSILFYAYQLINKYNVKSTGTSLV
jgi:hypothetical protein